MEVSTTTLKDYGLRIAALAGILVAMTLVINLRWFDEALHPDLAELMPPRDVSMDDNAYPLLYGFLAVSGADPREAGLGIIARLRERFANGEQATLSEPEIDEILGHPETTDVWSEGFPATGCDSRFEIDCADRLIADAARNPVRSARLNLLLERYQSIIETSRFEENQEFDVSTPIPPYGSVIAISRIRLASAYHQGSTQNFLLALGDDIAFWKRMLRDGQSLIAKMVALAGLRNDTTFVSTLLRERSLAPADFAMLAEILTPLTDDERDIGETFLAELRISLLSEKSLALMLEGPPTASRLALQEHATLNEYYFTTTTPLRLRASLTAPEFFEQGGHRPLTYEVRKMPPPLYNLGGKFVLKWMANEMSPQGYISRVHDIDGRIALVLLQAEIARSRNQRVEDVIRASRYRNPYTLEPMDYDAMSGRLSFACLANPEDLCAVSIDRQH